MLSLSTFSQPETAAGTTALRRESKKDRGLWPPRADVSPGPRTAKPSQKVAGVRSSRGAGVMIRGSCFATRPGYLLAPLRGAPDAIARPRYDGAMRTRLLLLSLLVACADAGSHDRPAARVACEREPDRAAQAFIVGQEIGTVRIRGTLTAVDELGDLGGWNYRFETAEGESTLRWMSDAPLPLAAGAEYAVRSDYFPGFPDASGLLIHQEDSVFFASLTDQKPGQRALRDGIPGFEIDTRPGDCASREPTRCHEALVNVPVRIAHCGQTIQLHHGEAGRLCGAEIRVLVAQEVEYSRECADAGLPGVSLTIGP